MLLQVGYKDFVIFGHGHCISEMAQGIAIPLG